MTTKRNLLVSLIITVFMLSIPTLALSEMNPCGMSKNPCAKKERMEKRHEMMQEHHKMKLETMEMLRETMEILRDLNHKPSKEEKKKLSKMIERLEEMEATCETRKKEWKKGRKMKGATDDLGY